MQIGIIRMLLCASLVLGVAMLVGCSSDDNKPSEPGPVPTAAEAYASLEDAVFLMINSADPDEPADIDFTEALDLYGRIVADDPGNLDARIGVAVAGVMSVLANAQVNDTFHAWQDYLEEFTPFEGESGFLRPLGIAVTPTSGAGSLVLPFEMMGTTVLAGMQPELRAVDRTTGAVQAVLRDVVIPSLVAAAGHLAVVGADPDFVFMISPRLQGDLLADPLKVDQTDALALRAGILLLTAVCRSAVTYDLSFATHDAVGMLAALARETGSFLRLHPTGVAQLAQAGSSKCLNGESWLKVRRFVEGNTHFVRIEKEENSIAFNIQFRDRMLRGIHRSICSNYLPLSAYHSTYIVASPCANTRDLPGAKWNTVNARICSGEMEFTAFSSNVYVPDQRDIILTYPLYLGTFRPKEGTHHSQDVDAVTVHHLYSATATFFERAMSGGIFGRLNQDFRGFLNIARRKRSKDFMALLKSTPALSHERLRESLEPKYPGIYGPLSEVEYLSDPNHRLILESPELLKVSYEVSPFRDGLAYVSTALQQFLFFGETAQEVLTPEEYSWLMDNLPRLAKKRSQH